MFFVLGAFALFGISLGCEPKRKLSNIWLSLFLLLAFVRIFFNDSFGNKQQEWFNFWISCAGFIYVFCGVLLFYVVYSYAGKAKEYLKPILVVCILNVVLTSVQLMNKDFMWTNAPSICGFMENSSQLGQYSALSLPILFYLNPFYALIPLFTLIASKSISPMLASVVGMAFFSHFQPIRAKIKVGTAIILIVIGILNFGHIKSKFQCRPIMWQKTLKIALQRPYIGWGYQSFNEKILENKAISVLGGREFSRPHNDYLHGAQELGFSIIVCAVVFFIGLFKKIKPAVKDKIFFCLFASIITVLVNMSGQTLIRYASISGTFIVLLALFCIKLNINEKTI